MDNEPYLPHLVPDWGLSLCLEAREGPRLLMDTGSSFQKLERNARALGLDLASLDAIFISHWHADHSAALPDLLARYGLEVPVFVPRRPGWLMERQLRRAGAELVVAGGPRELLPGFWSTGDLGGEHALVAVLGERGLVILTGCSHPGPREVVRVALAALGGIGPHALIGGFHIASYRDALGGPRSLVQARAQHPQRYAELEDAVERILCRYPIPLLQKVGHRMVPLLYQTDNWPMGRPPPKRYQRARHREAPSHIPSQPAVHSSGFDNRLRFYAGVEVMLATLAPLLTPLIRREWTHFVQRRNRALGEEDLQSFLFQPNRVQLQPVRKALSAYQRDRCFYCGEPLTGRVEVDHFLPWSRCGSDALENLVAAHRRCNNSKRDHLASVVHLRRWRTRFTEPTRLVPELEEMARDRAWASHPARTLRLARAMYLVQPRSPLLWVRPDQFTEDTQRSVQAALAV